MPGRLTSTVKRVAPVTFSRPFCRGIGLPITVSSALGGNGGGSSDGTSPLHLAQTGTGNSEWKFRGPRFAVRHHQPFCALAAASVAATTFGYAPQRQK